ncbi:MAG TPA: radical SAM protein [Micromonosporaceae bacterium]
MVSRIVLDLTERLGQTPLGGTVELPAAATDAATVTAWCERTGNELLSATDTAVVVRRGRADPNRLLDDLPADRRPGVRLWLYTNFDCNLACDYCCSRSSPTTPRRALGVENVARLVAEGAAAGVREVFLTGGEPFMLPDLDHVVAASTAHLPTTLLTNGMLWRGRRLQMLKSMPRGRLTLQISLDSATPENHDRHRGRGSWQRALGGIRLALGEGFRVRVAATVAATDASAEAGELAAFHRLLDGLGIPRSDQLVRPIAKRGFADNGVAVTVETLIPEVTVTADGVYWHPVAADHDDQLVSRQLFPLADAIDEVRRRFTRYRRTAAVAAERFPCA